MDMHVPSDVDAKTLLDALSEHERAAFEVELGAVEAMLSEAGIMYGNQYLAVRQHLAANAAMSEDERLEGFGVCVDTACRIGELLSLSGRYLAFYDHTRVGQVHPGSLRLQLRWIASGFLTMAQLFASGNHELTVSILNACPAEDEVEVGPSHDRQSGSASQLSSEQNGREHSVDETIAKLVAQIQAMDQHLPQLVADARSCKFAEPVPSEFAESVDNLLQWYTTSMLRLGRERQRIILTAEQARRTVHIFEEQFDLLLVMMAVLRARDRQTLAALQSLLPEHR